MGTWDSVREAPLPGDIGPLDLYPLLHGCRRCVSRRSSLLMGVQGSAQLALSLRATITQIGIGLRRDIKIPLPPLARCVARAAH